MSGFVGKELHLCIVGIDKHWIEKDLIKFFRKVFARKTASSEEEKKGESNENDDLIPLKGVAKKRGKTFGFLQFTDLVEKTNF